ncbi:MAG: GNAT family N-acetyltransferase [Dehalococcoidia bacterium]
MDQLSIEIRQCRIEDIGEVLALWVRADAVPRPTDHPSALAKRLERDPELFLIATDGSKVVGTLMGGWDGWRGNMYRLAIDPQYRRLGLARRLVEEVETCLRRLGAERITSLEFKDENAVAFWESVGYAQDNAVVRYAKDLA